LSPSGVAKIRQSPVHTVTDGTRNGTSKFFGGHEAVEVARDNSRSFRFKKFSRLEFPQENSWRK
jgi:hypothetical protein